MQKNYEVVRLIKENMNCHIIADNVKGETLGGYVMQNPHAKKDELLGWMTQLARELERFSLAKGLSGYQYLTPFCVVLKQDNTLALLNLKAKENQTRLDHLFASEEMKRFLPENNVYNDIYSFGKTIQFLLAKTELEPKLTRKEERRLQEIISTCLDIDSKYSYRNFEEIIVDISRVTRKSNLMKKIILGLFVLILGVVAIIKIVMMNNESILGEHRLAYMDAGITYFNEFGDYEKSEELFSHVNDSKIAEYYQKMAAYMQGEINFSEKQMEMLLSDFQDEVGKNIGYDEKYSLIKVYDKLNTEHARAQLICLAEEILDSPDWQKNEEKIREYLESAKKIP